VLFVAVIFVAAAAKLVLAAIVAVIVGAVFGYAFRGAIGKDLTKFQIADIANHLETYAQGATVDAKAEIDSLVSDLKKKL
jgi:uncharacterized membrane protein YraQ (UPF0718 family)